MPDCMERRERLAPLLPGLPEVLELAAGAFSERDFVLLLADSDGVVVDARGGGAFADEARRVRLISGSHWGEATRGTNAIGTALVEGCPVEVRGAAHWARPNHGLVCYAAPICDPAGDIVAVLDATSFVDRADAFARLALQSTARALEERLRAQAYAGAGMAATLERLIDGHRGGAALVERVGGLRRANAAARAWLAAGWSPDWRAIAAAAPRGDLLPVRGPAGAPLALVRVEPVHDAAGRLIAAILLDEGPPAARASPARPAAARPRGDPAPSPFAALHGDDPRLDEARRLAARLAPTALPLLLLAETGTGKDVLARAIHAASPRSAGPFVALNCGALSEQLLDSELFGYGPGAFTGALKGGRDGHLAAAHTGTLFLDEVAEMPPGLQARLLRFLESGAYHRVGEAVPRRADVRLVCATCRDLPALVRQGAFRADLYYRIRGASLSLPPVRARADTVALARALLRELAAEAGQPAPALAPRAEAAIAARPWPGNIRELKTALRVALALADGPCIDVEHLPADEGLGLPAAARGAPPAGPPPPAALADVEGEAVRRALAGSDGNLSEAARQLGVARSTLYRMMERHGLR